VNMALEGGSGDCMIRSVPVVAREEAHVYDCEKEAHMQVRESLI
jgi:hypothetical protein